MKTIYLECNMGAAGDMLMSALYEICEQKDLFLTTMNRVFSPFGVTITAEPAQKCGIHGTHMTVLVHGSEEGIDASHSHGHQKHQTDSTGHQDSGQGEHQENDESQRHNKPLRFREYLHNDYLLHRPAAEEYHNPEKIDRIENERQHDNHIHDNDHHHESYSSILEKINTLSLPETVRKDIAAIYQVIGEAEAKVHNTTLTQIHFHEVGTLDALADVTGCALLIYLIAPEQILASPVHVGNGFVKCAHGILPVPAPATAEILKGIPYYSGSIASELCTPTGAAVLKHFVTRFTPLPPFVTESVGYGMGKKDFPIANCVRALFGRTYVSAPTRERTASFANEEPEKQMTGDDSILSISANIDDMTGEALGLATEIFMSAGALDVYTIPIQMKKNRPGILLACLCEQKDRDKFTGLFFLHTTTRGVRYQTYERAKLESTLETRETPYGNIRIKKSSGYGVEKEKAEFEDLKSVVLKNNCELSIEAINKELSDQRP